MEIQLKPREGAIYLQADGYESLALVLQRAFIQAAHGKGKERHAGEGEPFDKQMMQDMARRFGVGALLGQAFKKSEESQRLPHDRAVAELLGAINYLAGAVIAMEGKRKPEPEPEVMTPPAANDNSPVLPPYYQRKQTAIDAGACKADGITRLCDGCIGDGRDSCAALDFQNPARLERAEAVVTGAGSYSFPAVPCKSQPGALCTKGCTCA